jgi:predicted membrane channel-forming protein YqfA (hemolysin III family)
MVFACFNCSALHIDSCSVYGATLVMLYAASTFYHSFRSPRLKHIFKLFFVNRFMILSTLVYVMLGWLAIIAIKPIMAMIPPGCILWLVAGGLFYTVGVLFFAWHKIPYKHAIWHLFVVAGSVCHFFAVVFYVIPSSL